jgi:ornithine carbamoyltransferase
MSNVFPFDTKVRIVNQQRATALADRRWRARAEAKPRHCFDIADLGCDGVLQVIDAGLAAKQSPSELTGGIAGARALLLFDDATACIRLSFEAALLDLRMTVSRGPDVCAFRSYGGALENALGIWARYYDAVVFGGSWFDSILDVAESAQLPLINGHSRVSDPCQVLGDLLTIKEYFGQIEGMRVAYIGDGEGVFSSLLQAAKTVGIKLAVCTPLDFAGAAKYPTPIEAAGAKLVSTPQEAVADADVIYTDAWMRWDNRSEMAARRAAFQNYVVSRELVAAAPEHALVMHCSPGTMSWEITPEVLRGARSIVLDQAENRRFAQRALIQRILSSERATA